MRKFCQIILVGIVLVVASCRHSDNAAAGADSKHDTYAIATVKSEIIPLYFPAVISPLRMMPVLSKVNGQVISVTFQYGHKVKKNQVLLVINSPQLASKYRSAINSYLEKKNAYTTSKREYEVTKQLYEAKVLSRDEYINSESQYRNSILTFYQSQFQLTKVLSEAGVDQALVERLTINDTDAVNKLLRRTFNNIKVVSPTRGIALFPIAGGDSSSGSSENNKKVSIGQNVKEGQLLLSIGDLMGLSSELKVSEININLIHVGMPIKLTGDAFPGIVLHGKVVGVSSQANPNSTESSGTSLFDVKVIVPSITEKQSKLIHVGMTAKVEIDIKQKPVITVPVNAVICKNGQTMVTLVTGEQHFRKMHHRKDVPVATGKTTVNSVEILKGLKKGQKVVVYPESSGVCL